MLKLPIHEGHTILCKIACEDASCDECIEYKKKKWRPLLPKNDVLEILDLVEAYKRSGFQIVINAESLYIAHKDVSVSGESQFFVQKKLFPLIFDNYTLEDDIGVVIGAKEWEEKQQSLSISMKKFVIKELYEALSSHHKRNIDENEEVLNLPEYFLPKLCLYQERTLRWLLTHEKCRFKVKKFFNALKAKDGTTQVFKNLFCTQFNETDEFTPADIAPGGILADEMGLGKTVEMLALILLHKRKEIDISLKETLFKKDQKDNTEYIVPSKKLRQQENVFCICSQGKENRNKIIECKMCHRWQHEKCVLRTKMERDKIDSYMCPSCWKTYTDKNLIKSGATLIITPNVIKQQWIDEIKRHITNDNVRLYVYNGISNGDWISPHHLSSDYDIVLTDYGILRHEVFYTSANDTDRVMRYKRRSMKTYTPLCMINWFRVCLDEAQMVESDVSKMAALVRTIPAEIRWAVTGTPFQRSIDDIYPLIRFIGWEHIITPAAWKTLVKDFMLHYNNGNDRSFLLLVKVLKNLMWRTSKKQVLEELPIPPQTEKIHRVVLSDLERLFYTEQHEECEFKFDEVLNRYNNTKNNFITSTSHQIMSTIMTPLLKIRQCCTIPVVTVNNGQTTTKCVAQKQFLQPNELHAHLKLTNEMECKSELRSLASSYNGCAAIYFIKGNYSEAIRYYESVLKLAKEYATEKNISVDSLLQIHALYNVQEAFKASNEIALEVTKDKINDYEHHLNELEWKYLETYASQLRKTECAYQNSLLTLQTRTENLDEKLVDFLSMLLEIDDVNLQSQLIAKIIELRSHYDVLLLQEASSLDGVLYIIISWYDELMVAYKKVLKSMEALNFYTSNVKPRSQVSPTIWQEMSKFVSTVYDCHLVDLRKLKTNGDDEQNEQDERLHSKQNKNRKQNQNQKNKKLCKLCLLRSLLDNFECKLFKKSIDVQTNTVEGDENPQLQVQMIKTIFGFLKPKRTELAFAIEKHLQILENMQSFCKKAIKYWIEIEFTVKAFDELDMCKMRIGLTDDEEEKSIYKIRGYELDISLAEQQNNLQMAQRNFVQKLARLKYIKHLESNSEMNPCPICQLENEIRHIFLECGHQLCLSCYKRLVQYSGCKLTCFVCRNVQSSKSVYFVTYLPSKNKDCEEIEVFGTFSSKITCIVELVLRLQRDQNQENDYPLKILIFSQWLSVLHALADAFQQNKITHLLHTNVRTIEHFKNRALGITCFLMPLSKGNKGLNLVEATHVFLVEPILNPSEEQQAIGRVHRFGQTRPTVVHRFIVEDTIEDNIHKFVAAGRELETEKNFEFDNLTFQNLKQLFELRNLNKY